MPTNLTPFEQTWVDQLDHEPGLPHQPHLYLYNRNHQRQPVPDHPSFYFFGSGSSGNAVYLKHAQLLIDLGFPFKKYVADDPTFFYQVHYLLLTHEHTDHLNTSALLHILRTYPHIHVIITKRMWAQITDPLWTKRWDSKSPLNARAMQKQLKETYRHRFIFIDESTQSLTLYGNNPYFATLKLYPHLVTHGNIINVAYELETPTLHVLYASDLDHVMPPAGADHDDLQGGLNLPLELDSTGHLTPFKHPFDLIFLEANYDQDILRHALEINPDDPHARGNQRHISEQESWRYIDFALASDGLFVPLHASPSFGTLVQHLD